MSALPQLREHRYTIEEFEEMNFGDLAAELIDGLVVVAEASSVRPAWPHHREPRHSTSARA